MTVWFITVHKFSIMTDKFIPESDMDITNGFPIHNIHLLEEFSDTDQTIVSTFSSQMDFLYTTYISSKSSVTLTRLLYLHSPYMW